VQEPIARWNSARGVWERAEVNILCGHSALYWEIFPTSGTWDVTGLYPLPTPERPTDASGCSSSPGLLPTPRPQTKGGDSAPEAEIGGKRPSGSKRALNLATVTAHLLKTPTAQLAVNGGSQHPDKRKAGGHGPTLADQVEHLLPTPAARDGKGRDMPGRRGGRSLPDTLLPTPRATDGTKWGPGQGGQQGGVTLPSAVVDLLPTPRTSDTGMPGRRASEGFRPPLSQVLLPTPAAHDSGNTPENHLRKKPGRSQVTSLQVIVDYDLLPTGGLTDQPSPAGRPSPDDPRHVQPSLDAPEND
jgi:hypothetical protein